jgi:profilin
MGSWQTYIDDQLINSRHVKHAVIAGHDGQIWAKSAGFDVTVEDLKKLLQKYDKPSMFECEGAVLANVKYMYLSKLDRVVRLKKGTNGAHCIKTVQALIVCVYDHPTPAEQCASVTEKLGEYLISCGY